LNQAHYHGGHPQTGRRIDKGQIIKWSVYALLLLNFFYYFFEEMYIASHALADGGSLQQWAEQFATTIDELGWFGLLAAFELETYALSDETLEKKKVAWSLHGARLFCYLLLAHTVFARVTTVMGFEQVTQATEVTSLCELADQGIDFGENYLYTPVTRENCATLSDDSVFYFVEPTVVADSEAHALEERLVWVDLNDAVMWILVVWAIELTVWLQNRNISGGRLMVVSHAAKVFYVFLWAHAAWWAYHGHWVWAWDQALWIAGFWAIENNLSEWRDEIRGANVFDAETE